MRYKVSGQHATTRKRRIRTYAARSEDEARQRGAADGLTVDAVELLPPEQPTPEQQALATSIGQNLPPSLDKEAASDWLARIQQNDKLASPVLRAIASDFGIELSEHVGKRRLFTRLFGSLNQEGREIDLAAWFTFRVYRELVKGRYDVAIATPFDPAIQAIAGQLLEAAGVVESIRRYRGEDLIWFGQWTGSSGRIHTGGSNRTKAYKEAAQRLRPLVAAKVRAEEIKQRELSMARADSTRDREQEAAARADVVVTTNSPRSAAKWPISARQLMLTCAVLGLLATAFALFG